jgi:hypothetical protein
MIDVKEVREAFDIIRGTLNTSLFHQKYPKVIGSVALIFQSINELEALIKKVKE